jgi:hypothetical protein
MEKKALLLAMVIMFVLFTLVFPSVVVAPPAMPIDLKMVEPDPSLPKELRDFWGKWQGMGYDQYRKRYEVFIIIERIDVESVDMWGNPRGEWKKWNRKVVKIGDEYRIRDISSRTGRMIELSLRKDGKMDLDQGYSPAAIVTL